VYHFGEFIFDARSGELCRGGQRLRLRPQPSALLEHLVKHAGEVVRREDLRDLLWPNGTFVCFDHGLNSCIKQLRAALGDERTAPRYLETLPRRGYRFIAATNPGPAPGGENDLDLSCNLRIVAERCHATITLTTSNGTPHSWTTDSTVHMHDALNSDSRMVQSLLENALLWFRSGRFRESTAPTR
jgi:DNA-binding winged helix-turn-helix (wHTH) protein